VHVVLTIRHALVVGSELVGGRALGHADFLVVPCNIQFVAGLHAGVDVNVFSSAAVHALVIIDVGKVRRADFGAQRGGVIGRNYVVFLALFAGLSLDLSCGGCANNVVY
jgi:hypothetical protein